MHPDRPFSFVEQSNAWLSLMTANMATAGTEAFLSFQADLVVGVETGVSEWLLRRREALLDARRLVIRMRDCEDMDDLMRAQQDWLTGAYRRMAADAMAFQSAVIFANQVSREAERQAKQHGGTASITSIESRRPGLSRPPTITGSTRD